MGSCESTPSHLQYAHVSNVSTCIMCELEVWTLRITGDRQVTYLSLASVSLLMLVHVLVGRMHFLEQERWRSVGAGVAISYVFLNVLPHLSSKQYALQDTVGTGLGAFLEHHAYLLALAGFVLYFGLAGVAKVSRTSQTVMEEPCKPHPVVRIVVLALAVYCFLVGYLIGEQLDHRYEPVIIFALAMTIHMAGVDHTVHDRYPKLYDNIFRYVLATATFVGWLLGIVTTVPDIIFALVFSFVVGTIIIMAFLYELPVVMEGRRYWLFVSGVIGFSALLLIYEAFAKIPLSA